jgi:hypothetical protein
LVWRDRGLWIFLFQLQEGVVAPVPTKHSVWLEAEIFENLNALLEAYDALWNQKEHEHYKKFAGISHFASKPKVYIENPKGAQTYTHEIQICCNVCIYVATSEEELNWHMGEADDLAKFVVNG